MVLRKFRKITAISHPCIHHFLAAVMNSCADLWVMQNILSLLQQWCKTQLPPTLTNIWIKYQYLNPLSNNSISQTRKSHKTLFQNNRIFPRPSTHTKISAFSWHGDPFQMQWLLQFFMTCAYLATRKKWPILYRGQNLCQLAVHSGFSTAKTLCLGESENERV